MLCPGKFGSSECIRRGGGMVAPDVGRGLGQRYFVQAVPSLALTQW
jgi:hypothetical protein